MLLAGVSILPGEPKLKEEEEVEKNFALLLLPVKWLLSLIGRTTIDCNEVLLFFQSS
jgi:hypothetical protein